MASRSDGVTRLYEAPQAPEPERLPQPTKTKDKVLLDERGLLDLPFLALTVLLVLIGVVMVFSASYARAYYLTGNSTYYFARQAIFAVVGIGGMLFVSRLNYQLWRSASFIILAVSVVFLMLVPLIGSTANGAKRWIEVAGIRFQPSELAKIAIIMTFSAMISTYRDKMRTFRYGIAPFGAIMIVLCGLVALERHFSCILIMLLLAAANGFVRAWQVAMTNDQYLKRFFSYFDIPNPMYQGTLSVEKRDDNDYCIEFRDVSFRYPNTETYALRHVSLRFRIGERLAVVGMNGSGKTTFIKLLCRLYDPTEGVILLNGVDIRKYNYDEYLSIFSGVFQDFRLFSFSLGQNVAAGAEYDRERAVACLREAGFGERLAKMPEGLETSLYQDFDKAGMEISGGEAQKIALARALYKNAPFIVLDEPTAALDPVSEYEVYRKFNEISGGRTAVYISHRLASCRFCDEILVFHEGQIAQHGAHEALLAESGGKYAELWNAQAQYYTDAQAGAEAEA